MSIILRFLIGTRIDRYFYKELIFSIILVYVGVLSIFVMLDYANNTDYFDSALRDRQKEHNEILIEHRQSTNNTSEIPQAPTYLHIVLIHYFCQLPFLFYLLTPVVITIAISFTVLRMSKNNEFLILKTSGISIRKILKPAMIISILFTAVLLAFNEWGLPIFVENVHVNKAAMQRKKFLNNQAYTDPKGMILYISSYESRMQTGEYIYAVEYKDGLPEITEAESIKYDYQRGWVLGKGLTRRVANVSSNGLEYHKAELTEEFEANEKVLNFHVLPGYIGKRSIMLLEEMSISEIFQLIQENPSWVAPRVQLQRHLAFPFAPILLFLMTISILLNSQNKNLLLGVGLSIFFSFAFYGAVIIASGAAIQGDIPADISISAAVFPFAIASIFMFVRLRS